MTGPTAVSSTELKAAQRRDLMARRRGVHAARKDQAAADLAARVATEIPTAGNTIAGYWPLGDEIDCRPALAVLKAAGAGVALPVVAGQGQVLLFRSWCPGDQLEPGPFGTAHPTPRATVVAPNILLLPLIAFDATGHRLGYGAGYYDRTVAALRKDRQILVVGIAYDEQEVAAVPTDRHDQRMDAVITDRRTLVVNEAFRALKD